MAASHTGCGVSVPRPSCLVDSSADSITAAAAATIASRAMTRRSLLASRLFGGLDPAEVLEVLLEVLEVLVLEVGMVGQPSDVKGSGDARGSLVSHVVA